MWIAALLFFVNSSPRTSRVHEGTRLHIVAFQKTPLPSILSRPGATLGAHLFWRNTFTTSTCQCPRRELCDMVRAVAFSFKFYINFIYISFVYLIVWYLIFAYWYPGKPVYRITLSFFQAEGQAVWRGRECTNVHRCVQGTCRYVMYISWYAFWMLPESVSCCKRQSLELQHSK